MRYEILHQGAFPILKVNLDQGENIKAESGAMVTMSPGIRLEGKIEGGLMGGIGRMLAGEKFFFQTMVAQNGPGEVMLAASPPGGVADVQLDGSYSLLVQKDGFLAGSSGISVDTKMQNLAKGLFSGEGFFIVRISGSGLVFVNSFGSIHPLTLQQGEEVIIDNQHLVAWPDYMHYTIEKASSGWMSSITSGEGLVCRFRGPGTVMIQTRNPRGFGEWIRQFMPTSS